MGLADKIKGIFNPETVDDDNYDESYDNFDAADESGNYSYEDDYQQNPQQQNNNRGYNPNSMQQGAYNKNQQQGNSFANQGGGAVGLNGNNIDINIKIVRPVRFDSVEQIADHLISRRTVVLNLEAATKEDSRRMIDFLTGVIYAINGNIKKITPTTFVMAPANVDISTEQQLSQQMGREMYNNNL